ncbi:MAG: hypothetical protein SFV23_04570 [Planctomycetaceae bacterium]|nr:hypothetical protein [Planctomycetaceae bacterium]
MAEDEFRIWNHFRPHGGIVDLTALDEDVKLLWQLPLRYLNDAISPARLSPSQPEEELPSYLAYVHNPGFNAAIRHEERAMAAGLFVGLPFIAHQACRLFATRMDQATGLPLCDPGGRLVVYSDPIPLPTVWSGLQDPATQALTDITRFEEETPLTNNLLATFMFDIAMRYVAMHECMHFALGHARFCQTELGLDAFEDASPRRSALDPITSQTLEFIADRHTMAGLVVDLDEGRLFHEWCREAPDFITVPVSVWHRRVLVATVALISRLWTSHGSMTLGDLSSAYPHPYERVCWMVCGLSEMARDKSLAYEHDLSMALSVGSLDRNFQTARQDIPLIERDNKVLQLFGHSELDHGYDVVRARAVEIQHVLYKKYGPFYPESK